MADKWLKIGDFAKEAGCTPANIYRYIKAYPDRLGSTEVVKQGRFTMISPEGQEFIREQMYPKTMSDSTVADELNRIRALLSYADHRNAAQAEELAALRSKNDVLQRELGEQQRLLAASTAEREAQEAHVQEVEETAAKASAEAQEATQARAAAEERAAEQAQRAEAAEARAAALEAELAKRDKAGLWARITRKW